MTSFSTFTISFGALLCLLTVAAAWVFRTSAAPLLAKLAIPFLLVVLACATPYEVSAMMGFPTTSTPPAKAELIAFVPHDDDKRVDLWLREGNDAPRAYSVELTESMKKTLKQAQAAQAGGGRAMLVKKGRKGPPRANYTDIDGGSAPYELLPDAFQLPKKDVQ